MILKQKNSFPKAFVANATTAFLSFVFSLTFVGNASASGIVVGSVGDTRFMREESFRTECGGVEYAAMSDLRQEQKADVMKKEDYELELSREWDKTFPRDERVKHEKVVFKNRYGIALAGDLYMPANLDGKAAAVAVCGPFGAVKEQASGLYAQTLAAEGFVTLAFDPSFTGESGGSVRNVASPDINTEDFCAAVDFLVTLDCVDADKIGIIGICGFGGFGLNAAAMDTRIKATVTSTMYDMCRVTVKGYFDSMSENDSYELLKRLNEQRTADARSGVATPSDGGLPDKLTGEEPKFVQDYYSYYKTPRGFHERSINSNGAWNTTSSLPFMNMPILAYSDRIRGAVLMIHGSEAHSRYFSEDAFKKLKGDNKELLIVEGASHVDLYDRKDVIPFSKIVDFFKSNM